MQYLHTMIRSANLEKTLDFFINKIGLQEVKRYDNEQGKFTLVFLCASEDLDIANYNQAPMIEITYNWPDKDNENEKLEVGETVEVRFKELPEDRMIDGYRWKVDLYYEEKKLKDTYKNSLWLS